MTAFKEFQGKTLDQAIEEACTYYGVPREKLEIDIVNDAKSGIFGLVGAKKATIMAARAAVASGLLDEGQVPQQEAKGNTHHSKGKAPKAVEPKTSKPKPQEQSKAPEPRMPQASKPEEVKPQAPKAQVNKKGKPELQKKTDTIEAPDAENSAAKSPNKPAGKNQGQNKNSGQRRNQPTAKNKRTADMPQGHTEQSDFPSEEPDDDRLAFALDLHTPDDVCAEVCNVISRFITPIVGEIPCTASANHGRIRVEVDCGDAAGILVGRDGQTLAAIQYLTARIAGKKLGGAVRLQIDVGNYRERQEERLRELAMALAEKVKTTKRSQSTRPLTAYQRRIIHLALETDEQLHTHSKGDGAQKRVIIQLRKAGKNSAKDAPQVYEPDSSAEQEADFMDDSQFFPEDTAKA